MVFLSLLPRVLRGFSKARATRQLIVFLLLLALSAIPVFPQEKTKLTIAVLPFETSGIAEGEMLYVVDALASQLTEIECYQVLERTMWEAGPTDCAEEECQIEKGREIGANRLLVGSMVHLGSRFIVSMKLIDVEAGQSIDLFTDALDSIQELENKKAEVQSWVLEAETELTLARANQQTAPADEPIQSEGRIKDIVHVVPRAAIKLDGKTDDWFNVQPVIVDMVGDDEATKTKRGTDIGNIFLARDDKYLYVRFDLADGPPNSYLSPTRYVEYNLNLYQPAPWIFIRLQTRFENTQWRAQLTEWNSRTRSMKVFATGQLRIRENLFEAKYPLEAIAKSVENASLLLVSANAGFDNSGTWIDTDRTVSRVVKIGD